MIVGRVAIATRIPSRLLIIMNASCSRHHLGVRGFWTVNIVASFVVKRFVVATRGYQKYNLRFSESKCHDSFFPFSRAHARSTEHGARSMEHGARSMEHGARSAEHGAWSTEHGAWSTEHGARSMEHGARSTEHGAWSTHTVRRSYFSTTVSFCGTRLGYSTSTHRLVRLVVTLWCKSVSI